MRTTGAQYWYFLEGLIVLRSEAVRTLSVGVIEPRSLWARGFWSNVLRFEVGSKWGEGQSKCFYS